MIVLSVIVGPLALKSSGRSIYQCVGRQYPVFLVGGSLGVFLGAFCPSSRWVNFSVPLLVGLFVGGSVVGRLVC